MARRFFTYYLDTAAGLLERYIQMQETGLRTPEISEAMFMENYRALGMDVPVFSIMFGDADPEQLEQLAEATNARVFDGREDLIDAFRKVKGYN